MAKRTLEKVSPFKNFIRRQPVQPGEVSSDQYIVYGNADNFPLKLSKLVSESPSASSCISVISDFIEGDGFSDEAFNDMRVNKQGTRMSELHSMTAESLSIFHGFALNVKYNGEAKISELYPVNFEYCRLSKPDSSGVISKILYNPYFGTSKYRKDQTTEYDVFNPIPDVVMRQINSNKKGYKGQILWWGSVSVASKFYPMPSYYSAKNWMEVDAMIGEYHRNNLAEGFLQSVIFKLIGNPNAPSADPADSNYDTDNQKQEPVKTLGEAFDEMMSDNFRGVSRIGNIMAMWAPNKDAFPQLEAFPSNVNAQILDTIQNLTTKNITISTKVPSILANINEGVSLGGDGNTIRTSVKLMQTRAAKWQALLEAKYKDIFKHWVNPINTDIEIVDHNPFPESDTIDPQVWDSLNEATKKKWIQEHTSIEYVEDVQPTPTKPVQQVTNVLYNSYPDKAKANARKALKWNENNKGQCGSKMGWDMADHIANGKALPYKTIKRVKNYLVKNVDHMNKPFNESCNTVLFHAWGGKDMMDWAVQKVKEVEE